MLKALRGRATDRKSAAPGPAGSKEIIVDIGSGKGYPSAVLSNFAPHPFVLDGVRIASMEGFLQSLKFSNPNMQKHVCTLVGRAAKARGRGKNWRRGGKLHWNGRTIDRFSQQYQDLLDRAFETLYTTNESASKALLAIGGRRPGARHGQEKRQGNGLDAEQILLAADQAARTNEESSAGLTAGDSTGRELIDDAIGFGHD
jgi:hypothetical protein